MRALPLPEDREYGELTRIRFGPPEGVAEEDCYSHDALVGPWYGGAFDGAMSITVFVALDEEELERLNAQEVPTLQLTLIADRLMPWLLTVADYEQEGT